METNQKLNLIELALHLLQNEKKGVITVRGIKLKFDMSDYIRPKEDTKIFVYDGMDVIRHCGTSCCALGDWMILKYGKRLDGYVSNDFGISFASDTWIYLFDKDNLNSVIRFAQRVMNVLRGVNTIQFKTKAKAIRELEKEQALLNN